MTGHCQRADGSAKIDKIDFRSGDKRVFPIVKRSFTIAYLNTGKGGWLKKLIPDSIVEEIKSKNDIADVISSYVTLKRSGSHMQGLCPFHSEKSPSFTVFAGTQSFYCFGCAAAGDVVTFIRKIENLDYPEALQFLAARCGVKIPEENEAGNRGIRKSRILEMNREAARFFRTQMLASSEAKSYFINRGLTRETVNRFGLGYSGKRGYELADHLKKLGYTEDEMLGAMLLGKSERGIFPYFRNRVMFPIIDTAGQIIGFGGRVMDNSNPKYLNTPETPAFNKGRNLFALNFARTHCEKELILCEGYMDVIAMHAAGFCNAVATLGTALTQEQARLIKRYTGKVIISYDNDNAGHAASDRASKILTEAGLEVRILRIKDAKDPDEYIKTFGKDAFRRLLSESETKFDFILNNVLARYDISTDTGKIRAAAELCEQIGRFYSAVERELYTEKTASVLGLSKESLESEIKKQVKKRSSAESGNFEKQLRNKSLGIGDKINPEHASNPRAAAAEEALLGIMMLHPERLVQTLGDKPPLTEEDFITAFNRRVFTAIKKLCANGVTDVGALGAEFSCEEMGRIYEMQLKREGLDSASDAVFYDNITALRALHAGGETDIEKLISAKLSGQGIKKEKE